MDALGNLNVVVELVKAFHRELVERDLREIERHGQGQTLLQRLMSQFRSLAVIATSENAPAERLASDQQINPGDGVGKVLVRFSGELKELLNRTKTDMIC